MLIFRSAANGAGMLANKSDRLLVLFGKDYIIE